MSKQALTVYQELEKPQFLQELAKAIPNTLKPDRMVRLAYTLLRKNDALAKCSVTSIMSGVVECAQLGLELEGVLGHAYLVPFGGEATLIIGYRGFVHLMYQSGTVIGVSAEVVREGETFKRVLGTDRRLIHVPNDIPLKKIGKDEYAADDPEENWLGAYAAARFITGNTEFEYLDRALIFTARSRSKSYQKYLREGKETPWMKYPDKIEMWKKTPTRRLAKRMPTSTTDQRAPLLRAAMIDEYGERKGLLLPTLGGYQVNDNPPDEDENAGADVEPTRDLDATNTMQNVAEGREEARQIREEQAAPRRSRSGPPAVPRPPKKSTPAPNGNSDVLPKARVPRDDRPIDVRPTATTTAAAKPKPADDPVITSAEQTDLYQKALNSGWKLDEFRSFLTKRFKVDSVKAIRRSQLTSAITAAESGT